MAISFYIHTKSFFLKKKLTICTLLKLKTSALLKDTLKKIKRQATRWVKVFAKHRHDKVLASKIHNNSNSTIKFNNKIYNNSNSTIKFNNKKPKQSK